MFRLSFNGAAAIALSGFALLGAGCGSDDPGFKSPFTPKPECEGADVVPLSGDNQMIFSALTIGTREEGLDLDGDGEPDNKFAAVSSLAAPAIEDALSRFELVLPLEFFDLDGVQEDSCVKFAMYQGIYQRDQDEDGKVTVKNGGDCNDHVAAISPDATEIPDNGIDDDCDGLADEDGETPSTSDADADNDGVTIAQGDCDDTNDAIKPGAAEICGDGFDNDCDGVADWTTAAETPVCSPFDAELDPISVTEESFGTDGNPQIVFDSGEIVEEEGKLRFKSGPSLFNLFLPIEDINLELNITGATIDSDIVTEAGQAVLKNARLAGVLDTRSLDRVRGLDVEEISLRPEDSFADALYAGALGALLGLRKGELGSPGQECFTPDIDVDGDGLEAFCDSTPEEEPLVIDTCVDGDGTVITDTADTQCTEALDENGEPRFKDGISIVIKFDTIPTAIATER